MLPLKIDITFIGTPIATNYDPNPPGGSDVAFLNMWYRFAVKEAFSLLAAGIVSTPNQ